MTEAAILDELKSIKQDLAFIKTHMVDRDEIMEEPELRPEFVKKIQNLETHGKFTTYKSLGELRKEIEKV